MKMRLFRAICILVLSLAFTTTALAAGTPGWWDNPDEHLTWQQSVYDGTVANTGTQQQVVTVVVDVPNTYDPDATKDVWAQVEWEVVQGTAEFYTDSFPGMLIRWNNDNCPATPSTPFPSPPDGFGYMTDEGTFNPENERPGSGGDIYDNGNEMSYSGIDPQPACERIEFEFEVDPDSQLDYRIEVQTLCFGPNAVTLSAIDAGPALVGLPAFALVVVAVVGGAGLFMWKRRA
jgi:hypothetical protein